MLKKKKPSIKIFRSMDEIFYENNVSMQLCEVIAFSYCFFFSSLWVHELGEHWETNRPAIEMGWAALGRKVPWEAQVRCNSILAQVLISLYQPMTFWELGCSNHLEIWRNKNHLRLVCFGTKRFLEKSSFFLSFFFLMQRKIKDKRKIWLL